MWESRSGAGLTEGCQGFSAIGRPGVRAGLSTADKEPMPTAPFEDAPAARFPRRTTCTVVTGCQFDLGRATGRRFDLGRATGRQFDLGRATGRRFDLGRGTGHRVRGGDGRGSDAERLDVQGRSPSLSTAIGVGLPLVSPARPSTPRTRAPQLKIEQVKAPAPSLSPSTAAAHGDGFGVP